MHQGKLALHCAAAMAIAIKSDNGKTQLPQNATGILLSFLFLDEHFESSERLIAQICFRDYAIKMLPPKYHSSLSLKLLF